MIYPNQCQKDFGMVGRDYTKLYVSTCEIKCVQHIKRSNRLKDTAATTNSILYYLYINRFRESRSGKLKLHCAREN